MKKAEDKLKDEQIQELRKEPNNQLRCCKNCGYFHDFGTSIIPHTMICTTRPLGDWNHEEVQPDWYCDMWNTTEYVRLEKKLFKIKMIVDEDI